MEEEKNLCEMGCQEAQANFIRIFFCLHMTKEENNLIYEDLLTGSLQKKILTFIKFQEQLRKMKQIPGFS